MRMARPMNSEASVLHYRGRLQVIRGDVRQPESFVINTRPSRTMFQTRAGQEGTHE